MKQFESCPTHLIVLSKGIDAVGDKVLTVEEGHPTISYKRQESTLWGRLGLEVLVWTHDF